ncbi:guanine nucleotide-exchange factor SEC12 [Oratosquilla oratoria]|uniref:guanine nucleotide-exchange factor SEC12 n=1 Tax=Oratosquilla oratoria TaxID=337810 RepID=UPI003F770969
MPSGQKCETVANLAYPPYALNVISGRHVLVGGGGGGAKTGIRNGFDVYELFHTGEQTKGERVLFHDADDECIMSMAAWSEHITAATDKTTARSASVAIGHNQRCSLLRLSPELKTVTSTLMPENSKEESSSIRKRKGKKDKEDEKSGASKEEHGDNKDKENKKSDKTSQGDSYFSFDVKKITTVETVFSKDSKEEDIYQKCCQVFPKHDMLVTGGVDGHIRIWKLPNLTKVHDIKAHEGEVDDLHVKPDGREIVSVCKQKRECCVWNTDSCKKVFQIVIPTNGVKYKFFRAKYGTVENMKSKSRLFTISNPLGSSKPPALVGKWCGRTYTLEKTAPLKGTLSSLAVSDNGRYVATGTMDGTVYIIIAFSLQTLRVIEGAHNLFVTGLDWLPTNDSDAQMVTGFSDASVLSVSCDNTLKIHHVPKQEMIQVWVVALATFVVLFFAFSLASYLGL